MLDKVGHAEIKETEASIAVNAGPFHTSQCSGVSAVSLSGDRTACLWFMLQGNHFRSPEIWTILKFEKFEPAKFERQFTAAQAVHKTIKAVTECAESNVWTRKVGFHDCGAQTFYKLAEINGRVCLVTIIKSSLV